ncbi:MAG: HD domain-containing protein [Treponema sp.]|jgi:poly(A) polymerase|nr:HD domain-containing protein [Treponema sp.]
MGIGTIYKALDEGGYSLKLWGLSAIDRYLSLPALPYGWLETNADIVVLVRYFEGLRFPGPGIADAALDLGERGWYFRCVEPEEPPRCSYRFLSFTQDLKTQRFQDPQGIYPLLRELKGGSLKKGLGAPWWEGLNPHAGRYQAAMEGALMAARYEAPVPLAALGQSLKELPSGLPPNPEWQRVLLKSLLVSPRPDRGFRLLKASGLVEELWPELSRLEEVKHTKEFHPEGNGWNHTLETFRYRKPIRSTKRVYDFRLSLGLLLHDVGKPLAEAAGKHPFARHAELGAALAGTFLKRLGFDAALMADIRYLVKNHMFPAALPRLPLSTHQEILASPLFPTLLELYRCDESASFRSLEGYYRSAAAYQAYLKKRSLPGALHKGWGPASPHRFIPSF